MKFSFFKRQSQEKQFQKILEKYHKAAEQNPGDIRVHIKIAELYLENNKKDKAVEEYMIAARAYQDKRLFQIAVAIYKHVISTVPDKVDVYSELADLHLRNGFIGDCVAVLEKLANYYYDNDMRYEATNVLKKISRIDPENKFFKIKVAKFYETKDLSEEETLKQGPKDKWDLTDKKMIRNLSMKLHQKGFLTWRLLCRMMFQSAFQLFQMKMSLKCHSLLPAA